VIARSFSAGLITDGEIDVVGRDAKAGIAAGNDSL
jgi:hypothetical protein